MCSQPQGSEEPICFGSVGKAAGEKRKSKKKKAKKAAASVMEMGTETRARIPLQGGSWDGLWGRSQEGSGVGSPLSAFRRTTLYPACLNPPFFLLQSRAQQRDHSPLFLNSSRGRPVPVPGVFSPSHLLLRQGDILDAWRHPHPLKNGWGEVDFIIKPDCIQSSPS